MRSYSKKTMEDEAWERSYYFNPQILCIFFVEGRNRTETIHYRWVYLK
jgi:hypothetical protein